MSGGHAGGDLERPHVFLPAEPGASGPPLLLLHGTGGDEHDLLPLREHLSPGAAVLSPRGSVLEGSMPRFFRRLAEGVFDEEDLAARTEELASFVLAASEAYGVDTGSWVAVGFSNGANIATSLLMRRPEVLAGAVLLAAMVPYADPEPTDVGGRLAVISNGLRDPMATPALTATLGAQLRAGGARVEELPHGGGHQIDAAQLPAIASLIAV